MAHPRWTLTLGTLWLAIIAMGAPLSAGWAPVGGPAEPVVRPHLDPGRPELLYASVVVNVPEEGYLWRSEDAGATWRSIQPGLGRSSQAIGIDPTDPKVIWVWTPGRELWRSGDAGDTWSRRFTTPPDDFESFEVLKILVDPRDPKTLFRVDFDSGAGVRVAVSRDGGTSFRKGAFVPNRYAGDGIFLHAERGELVSFDQKGLEVSTDGGQTWRVRGRYRSQEFYAGTVAPSDPDTMYGLPTSDTGSNSCVVRSDDAGAHWRRLAQPRLPPNYFGCEDIAVDPKDARHVWVAVNAVGRADTRFLLFESRNGGETWSDALRAPSVGVVAAGGNVLYTGGGIYPGQGLYVSRNGGRTWQRRDQGIAAGDARHGVVAQRLPGGRAGRRLLALNVWIGSSVEELFRSDGGRDWVKIPFQGPFSIRDTGGSTVLAMNDRGLFRSRDGGETWRAVASAPPEPEGLLSDLTQPRYLALHTLEGDRDFGTLLFWMSDDGGVTWRQPNERVSLPCTHVAATDYCLGISSYAVDPFDATRRWMVREPAFFAPSTLFISNDAGASWHPAASSPPSTFRLAADPSVKDRILAATFDDGLLVSEDGGEHWRPLGQGLPDGVVIHQFARDARAAIWYAATVSQGIYRSLDGGSNWQLLEGAPDLEIPRIAIDPRGPGGLLAAFRGQGVWRWMP